MNPKPFTPPQFNGFLRAVLSCPFGNGAGNFALLTDLIGVEVEAKVPDGPVQTLLLKFMRKGRVEISVNLYDKHAAAVAEAEKSNIALGDDAAVNFLKQNIRVDITLHDAALRALLREAKFVEADSCPLTASMFNRAVTRLNRGKGKTRTTFVQWLLNHIFDDRLALTRMLEYRPTMVEEVRSTLEIYDLKALAVFEEWLDLEVKHRGSESFEQFAISSAAQPISRHVARTTFSKARKIGLDLDIPLTAYDGLYTMTHYFDLVAADRRALAVALEIDDKKVAWDIMATSRSNAKATIKQVQQVLVDMIANAHVPALRIGSQRK
jgi:hypothetical protein